MARKFVIGDIHGHYSEMMELFEAVRFNYSEDLLISLGDVVDHGPQPVEVIEKLRTIRNFRHVLGNHDEWCYQYLKYGRKPEIWTLQGGQSTVKAYIDCQVFKTTHLHFFEKASLYYVDPESRLFVHAGFDWKMPFENQKEDKEILLWNRTLFAAASVYQRNGLTFDEFAEIFIGHTPTQLLGETLPIHNSNVWMMDTGISCGGRLTIMDIETKEYWQSGCESDID